MFLSCHQRLLISYSAEPQRFEVRRAWSQRQDRPRLRRACHSRCALPNSKANEVTQANRPADTLRQFGDIVLGGTAHAISALAAAMLVLSYSPAAIAAEKVGEFEASGLIFKDAVQTIAIEDPDVQGVTIYISDFRRSITDKLAGQFFSEPSQASVTCAQTGPLTVADMGKIRGQSGHEVFSERKNLSFFQNKTLRVRRLYDEERHPAVRCVQHSPHHGLSEDCIALLTAKGGGPAELGGTQSLPDLDLRAATAAPSAAEHYLAPQSTT